MHDFVNNQILIIFQIARLYNTDIFIVGGFLRDLFLSKISYDIDFLVMENTKNIALDFSNKIKGAFVVLDEKEQSYRVVKKHSKNIYTFDFTFRRAKTLKEDLLKRDFSINSLAYKIEANFNIFDIKTFIDYSNSLLDIKNKKVRALSEEVFDDDPLRLLRAFRIASKYDFKIDKKTFTLIKEKSFLINKSSKERIHDELVKIFSYKCFGTILEIDKANLLGLIFEKIGFMKSSNEHYYHRDGLFGHSLEVLFCFEFIIDNIDSLFDGEILDIFHNYLDKYLPYLKILCLFHDIGKPDTFSIINNKVHFLNHEKISFSIIRPMLKDLKFSKKEIDFVSYSALYHMHVGNIARQAKMTNRACYRFFKRASECGLGLILFTMADWLASIRGVKKIYYFDGISKNEFNYSDFVLLQKASLSIIDWYLEDIHKINHKRILSGNDIMLEFNLKEGKIIGILLDELDEQQSIGIINTREEAISFIRNYLEKNK